MFPYLVIPLECSEARALLSLLVQYYMLLHKLFPGQ
jgi:hypothetical protein